MSRWAGSNLPRRSIKERRDGETLVRSACLLAGAALLSLLIASSAAADAGLAFGILKPKKPPAVIDFTLPGPDGKTVALKDFRGRVVLLNFWATWCQPCKIEMPSMQRVYDKYRAQGLVILALSVDAKGERVVKPFLDKYKFSFPVALDADMKIMGKFKVRGLPTTLVLDAQGKELGRIIGGREWDGKAALRYLEEVLKANEKSAQIPPSRKTTSTPR